MASSPEQTDPLLRPESSNLSESSFGSVNSTVVASPSSPYQRSGYRRVNSLAEQIDSSFKSPLHQDETSTASEGHGLGISNLDGQKRTSVPRKPVGSKDSPANPGAPGLLLSPTSAKLGGKLYQPLQSQPEGDDNAGGYIPYNPSIPSPHQPFGASSELEELNAKPQPTTTRDFPCSTRRPIKVGRGSWLAVTVLILSVYSTVFSAIWLMIAIRKPQYGHTITTAGKISPNTAGLVCAAFAKTIELSFVTVFVAFIGQLLSHRAMVKASKGITIAEMSMRSWVMQPGTMLTHWESVRYAGATFLGVFALFAALMAMVYTTASDALVAPKLKFGNLEERLLYGRVAATFANPSYIEAHCNTPITATIDPDIPPGETCIQIEHSGQAYHNYLAYLTNWVDNINIGNGSSDMTKRPDPVGMLYDNTTVKGNWINIQNMTDLANQHGGRIMNNVTMAMPHAGVFAAARDPINNILQPQDLEGLGEYYIQASVPSPVVNVLCATVTEDEMAPMVFSEWPEPNNNGSTTPNTTTWPDSYNLTLPDSERSTALDDLFGFNDIQIHPVFPKFPIKYNAIFNYSAIYGANAVYLLAASATDTYTMCSLRVALSPNCSTEYHASLSGGSLNSNCEDPKDRLAYSRSEPKAPSGVWSTDWINVASEWALGISLNAGITDGQATNARLLTQFIPTSAALDPSLPSISEALAILAGNTLLLSAIDSPFIHYWNYSQTVPTLVDPQYQAFNATLRTQNYASGGTQPWQGIFYIVLSLVFITNVCCLVYFGISGSLVTDFVEPQNLFSLSLNSPPSSILEGSCGGGPEKEHFQVPWHIELDREKDHLYIRNKETWRTGKRVEKRHIRHWSGSGRTDYEMQGSPVARMYSKLSRKRTSLL